MALLLKYGGMNFWTMLVDEFYDRVLAVPGLSPFFQGKNQQRIKNMMLSLLEMAITGEHFPEKALHSHKALNITEQHFQLFLEVFEETLNDLEVEPEDVEFLAGTLKSYHSSIVTS